MITGIVAALILGLAGSLHCVGMCGPIAFALPVNRKSKWTKFTGISSYNLGRIATYTILGILFGWFGKGLQIAGILQIVSIALGALIITMIFLPNLLEKWFSANTYYMRFNNLVSGHLRTLFSKKGNTSLFTLGMLNGLLPCGLVFAAIVGALEMGSPVGGATFMFFFGLGTAPAMFTLPWLAQNLTASLKNKLRRFVPVVMFIFGFMFILRGMNLDIPYISPKIEMKENIQSLDCCSSTKTCE